MSDKENQGSPSEPIGDGATDRDKGKKSDAGQPAQLEAHENRGTLSEGESQINPEKHQESHERKLNLTFLERLVSIAGGSIAIVAANVGGSVAAYHHFFRTFHGVLKPIVFV